jgi:hypothetical protein
MQTAASRQSISAVEITGSGQRRCVNELHGLKILHSVRLCRLSGRFILAAADGHYPCRPRLDTPPSPIVYMAGQLLSRSAEPPTLSEFE